MNEHTKESKFLDAINRYAEQQKAQISQEIEEYKNAKIEQATEQGLQDAYDLIRADVASRKAAIVNEFTKKELSARNHLYSERQKICDEVFRRCEERLLDFSASSDYTAFLEKSLGQIASVCGDSPCTVSVAVKDLDKNGMIEKLLSGAEIHTDNTIKIGGVRVSCPEKGILLDDTLDTRLQDQREWFIGHSGLKVV